MALAKLNAKLLQREHHKQNNLVKDHPIVINDQLVIRTQRLPESDESYSPTPEGIHQDNTEISSVTLIGRGGVTSGGESRLWKLEQPTGNYEDSEFPEMKKNLILDRALQEPWETLYFNDRMVKHEARAYDGDRPCYRDVIVNFMRKPLVNGWDMMNV